MHSCCFLLAILYIVISKHQLDLQNRQAQQKKKSQVSQVTTRKKEGSFEPEEELYQKPIVDLSGWQLPSEIRSYDTLSINISGAI